MKKNNHHLIVIYIVLIAFPVIYFSCKNTNAERRISPTLPASRGYQLVWSDEFDDTSIDTANWNFEIGGSGWGNHEQEYYQRDNASIENGCLVITGKKEAAQDKHYTSSRMTTQRKHEFLYGRIEARIKIPVAQGFWPAFWMLGADISEVGWPASGETDIMEHINTDSLIYGTLHWDKNGHVQSGDTLHSTPSSYHVYAVEWDKDSISWYIDTIKYHTVIITNGINSTEEFRKPFFILLNFALGGDWPGQKIDYSKLPAKMYVDYVRVYQKK
jgi:beta-glucanase (GH16 family)